MALNDLIHLSAMKGWHKQGLSDERLKAAISIGRQYIAYWREYPDMFVDFLCGGENAKSNTLKLYYYQRVFLRAVMRHRYVYAVFPRAFSKSFLSVLALTLRCVLFPNAKLFVTTGGKEQAANITREKVDELCSLIPGLKKEIDWSRGKSKSSKDMVEYVFKNGSLLNIVAAKDSSRGGRRTGGLVEEAILIDGDMLNNVIIPSFWGVIMRIIMENGVKALQAVYLI